MDALISVCIATYRRPELLVKLLQTLTMQIIEGFTFEVIVVDNDKDCSAEEIISNFKKKLDCFKIKYLSVPEKNIALARNAAVHAATGEYVAFIDDDEEATNSWLKDLMSFIQKYKADAIIGPVLPQYPVGAPQWIIKGNFFDLPSYPEGTSVCEGKTGNALVLKKWLLSREGPFDYKLGVQGGSDFDFFTYMYSQGAVLKWTNTAVVYEAVTNERLCLKWLLFRQLRKGQVIMENKINKGNSKIAFFIFELTKLFVKLMVLFIPNSLSKHGFYKKITSIAYSIGNISVFFTKWRYKEYRVRPAN